MQKLLIYVVALIVLGSAAFFIYTKAPRLAETSMATSTATQAAETQQVADEGSNYKVDISYRHVGIPAIDTKIDAAVAEVVASFKSDAASMGSPEPGFPKYSLQGQAAATYTGSDYVSERIDLYQDTGGAHGLPIVITLNYDAATGEQVSLDRALSLIGLSLKDVSAKALAQLHQEFGESVFAEGATPTENNYNTFLITPYNVTFIFQAYQVVAYAAGMPEITFARK